MTKILPHTRLVRSIMRAYGKSMMWTNLYDSGTRTVKCYARNVRLNGKPNHDARMMETITVALTALGKPFWIRTTKPSTKQAWGAPPAIIVGFPNDKD